MSFNCEISIESVISLFLIIVGGMFAFYQWKKTSSLKRAEYINELTEKIRTDTAIKNTIYLIEYDESWYSEEFHNGGEIELNIDKTLSYFSYICYLKKQRIITNKEFYFFKYEIKRIISNIQIQDYFYNLYHFSNKFKVPITFKYLFEYGEKNKFFDKDFYDNTSCDDKKYHKYLNF